MTKILQSFQQCMDSKRGSVCIKIDCIYNQLDSLETRQKTPEDDIDIRSSTASSSTSVTPSSIGKRKRATPLVLQVLLTHTSLTYAHAMIQRMIIHYTLFLTNRVCDEFILF